MSRAWKKSIFRLGSDVLISFLEAEAGGSGSGETESSPPVLSANVSMRFDAETSITSSSLVVRGAGRFCPPFSVRSTLPGLRCGPFRKGY